MRMALFEPFDIRKWFVLGFTAFLAGLNDGSLVGHYSFPYGRGNARFSRFPNIEHIPEIAMDWLRVHPIWLLAILAAIFLFIAMVLVLTWLSSRGTFMFLDNVVCNRALVVAPWYQFRILGNSLFLWRLGFVLACALLVLSFLVLTFLTILPLLRGRFVPYDLLNFVGVVCLWLLVMLIAGYVSLFTTSFVVPLMYKYRLKVLAAWQRFLPLLTRHLAYFLLYGLFLLLLALGVGIAIVLAGCLTCCVGFVLLVLPYIGSIILLPITFTYRAFSLEFLAQWGPENSLFPDAEPPRGGSPSHP